MAKSTRFSPEVEQRAIRLVLEQQEERGSQYAAIRSAAGKIGCNPETRWGWVRQAEREVKELRRANEILRKASAYRTPSSVSGTSKADMSRSPTR